MPQRLTVYDIAKTNIEQLNNLGAFTNKDECRYIYEDLTGCSIGVCLDLSTLRNIHQTGRNVASLDAISDIVSIPDAEAQMARQVQFCHDEIARKGVFPGLDDLAPGVIRDYLASNDLGRKAGDRSEWMALMRHLIAITGPGGSHMEAIGYDAI